MMPTSPSNLELLRRAIGRRHHVLIHHADLLFQEVYNDMVGTAPASAPADRADARSEPWLRRLFPTWQVSSRSSTILAHEGAVLACELEPDGRAAVTGGRDGLVKVWDLDSGRAVATLEGHTGAVRTCSFAPGGEVVASGGQDGHVILWNLPTQSTMGTIDTGGPVRGCAVSPDGSFLVTGGDDALVRLWTLGGELIAELDGHEDVVTGCDVAPDGRRIVSCSTDCTLRIWEQDTSGAWQETAVLSGLKRQELQDARRAVDRPKEQLPQHVTEELGMAALLAKRGDSRLLDAFQFDGEFQAHTDRERERLDAERALRSNAVNCCRFSPDGNRVVSGHGGWERGEVRVWDVATGEGRTVGAHVRPTGEVLSDANGNVHWCAFDPHGGLVASAGADLTVRLWSIDAGSERARFAGHTGAVMCCAWHPAGTGLIAGDASGNLVIWEVGHAATSGAEPIGTVHACMAAPDGRSLLAAGDSGIAVWDPTGELRAESRVEHAVIDCAYVPDNSSLVSLSAVSADIIHPTDLTAIDTLQAPEASASYSLPTSCCITPDRRFAVITLTQGMHVWSLPFRQLVAQPRIPLSGVSRNQLDGIQDWLMEGKDSTGVREAPEGFLAVLQHTESMQITCSAVAADGRFVLTGSDDGSLRTWSTSGWESHQAVAKAHEGAVTGCAISPDNRIAVSVGRDGAVNVWDLDAWTLVPGSCAHHEGATACAISADGRLLATVGADDMARVWSVAGAHEVARFPLAGRGNDVSFHPFEAFVLFASEGFGFEAVRLENVALGPVVVTALDPGTGLQLACPRCTEPIGTDQLGASVTCPGCALSLLINPFVIDVGLSERDRFEPEEWQLLSRVPLTAIAFVASVDGRIDSGEAAAINRYLQSSEQIENTLHRALISDIRASLGAAGAGSGELPVADLGRLAPPLKACLRRRLADDERIDFCRSVLSAAEEVGRSAEKRFGRRGRLSARQREALATLEDLLDV